jgi:hypothetical protein
MTKIFCHTSDSGVPPPARKSTAALAYIIAGSLLALAIIGAVAFFAGKAHAGEKGSARACAPNVRMPYEQSHAIKLSMLPPGRSPSEYELIRSHHPALFRRE